MACQLTLWRGPSRSDARCDERLDVAYEAALRLVESPVMLTFRLDDGRELHFGHHDNDRP